MKKTRTKRFIALLLTLMMAFTICGGVFGEDSASAETTGTITITNAQSGVTYTAYKIFDVTITADSTGYAYAIDADSEWLSYVQAYADATSDPTASDDSTEWSSGLTLALSADESGYVVTFDEDCFSAAKFAKYLRSVLENAETDTFNGTTDSEGTISNLALGYYLVVGTTASSSEDGSDSSGTTAYLGLAELTTTDTDVEIYDKNVEQTITKEVDADEGSVEIGEKVSFYIYGTVPPLTGYDADSYTYTITDSMTDGLTFTESQMADMDIELYMDEEDSLDMTSSDRDEIQLYVVSSANESGDTEYSVVLYAETSDESPDSSKTYYVKSTSDNTTVYSEAGDLTSFENGTTYYEAVTVGSLTYVEADDTTGGGFVLSLYMSELQDYVGYEIGILYKATVNEKANATTETNTATLTYSSDPDNSATTSTTDTTVSVYTSNIVIYKIDGSTVTTDSNGDSDYTNATMLSGASFVLIEYKPYSNLTSWVSGRTYYTRGDQRSDEGYNYTEVDTTETETPDSNTTYYVLRYYKYTPMYTATTDTEYNSGKTYYVLTTDEDGNTIYTEFDGEEFDESTTYYEYSSTGDVDWTEDIDEATVLTTDETGTVTIMGLDDLTYYLLEIEAPDGYNLLTDTVAVKVSAGDGQYSYTVYVENSSGSILPATGGTGRTVLYVIGILIIACACAALIVRRRISCRK